MSARLDTFDLSDAVMVDAVRGLTAQPKTLPAWIFYDSEGTLLFEKITCLTENYLTRIERKTAGAATFLSKRRTGFIRGLRPNVTRA